ncbi:MAG TPA: carboxypeptidase-like regulatory domain-containing protein, partial [bacterium]|nr:carboxypeptidase-like regulatory domain-containing protein [bacterium]
MRPLSPLFAVFSLIATASLAVAQSIEGVVTNGTAPLANIQVVAYDGTGNWGGNAYTDTAGAYAINGLVVGKGYKIQFSDGTGTYAAEWYDDAGGWTGATQVNAPSTGIDAVMEAGVTIAGTVTEEESGTALEGAWVYAYDTARQMSVSYATTDALGGYVLSGLKAGVSYKLSYNH